ncbi:MAG: ATP-binding protein, partial [Chloroflexi bacterium]|nr:ATP-binding protein [Chloroflexota bacterium]
MAHAIEVAKAYAQEPKGWLVITGPAGSGKTRIAAAIANQRIDLGHTALFIPVADLLDHLRSTFSPSSDIAYDELFEQVREVPLLILDDLGQESATPWAREKLAQLLGHRYNGGLPTVITTDSPIVELESRIRARIADATMTQTLTLRGPSGVMSTPVDRL